MRILFLHQHFKTPEEGGGIRSYHICSYLAKRGHDVIVISHKSSGIPERVKINGFEVIYLPIAYSNHLSFSGRIIAFLKYLMLSYSKAKELKFDYIYAISTPLSIGITAMLLRKPFVFEVGDLWPDVPFQMGIIKSKILYKWLKKLELKIYRNAELIVSMSEDIQRQIQSECPQTPNICITNFSDREVFNFREPDLDSSLMKCCYTGTAGKANDLRQILDFAKICSDKNENIEFNIMCEGKYEDEIKNSKLDNVRYIYYSSKEKAAEILSDSDFNFVCYAQYEFLGTGSPNKYFDGLAAGSINIINVKGWMERELINNKAGLYWDITKSEELLDRMKAIYNDKQLSESFRINANNLAKKFYDLNLLNEKLALQLECRLI